MEANIIKQELKGVFTHYLINGIEHNIPPLDWDMVSEKIKDYVFNQIEEYPNVKNLYIDAKDGNINFESYGTKFLSLKWENNIAYFNVPKSPEFSLKLFAEEVRACFWPVLNFILNYSNKNSVDSLWVIEE